MFGDFVVVLWQWTVGGFSFLKKIKLILNQYLFPIAYCSRSLKNLDQESPERERMMFSWSVYT